jgi:hypothetical protein
MPIAAQRERVRLLLPSTGAAQRITLKVRLPDEAGVGMRAAWLEVNGWQSTPQQATPEWQEMTFEIPQPAFKPGLNNVWLHFEKVTRLPRLPVVDITTISAGQEVGGFAHIYVNGYEVSPNERGYNVAILTRQGALQTANFDTHLDPAASTALADFILSAPAGAMVAIAAADEASLNLSREAGQAIQQATGAATNLRDCFRCSQAIIYQNGHLLEAIDPLRPVGLTTRRGLTEPAVAAIVESIWVDTGFK